MTDEEDFAEEEDSFAEDNLSVEDDETTTEDEDFTELLDDSLTDDEDLSSFLMLEELTESMRLLLDFAELLDISFIEDDEIFFDVEVSTAEDNLFELEEAPTFPSELSGLDSLEWSVYSNAPNAFSNSSW